MSELKPCPFCGGEPELSRSDPSTARHNEGAVHFAVSCGAFNCDVLPRAGIWQITPEEAVQAWNTRAETKTSIDTVDIRVSDVDAIKEFFDAMQDYAEELPPELVIKLSQICDKVIYGGSDE